MYFVRSVINRNSGFYYFNQMLVNYFYGVNSIISQWSSRFGLLVKSHETYYSTQNPTLKIILNHVRRKYINSIVSIIERMSILTVHSNGALVLLYIIRPCFSKEHRTNTLQRSILIFSVAHCLSLILKMFIVLFNV